MEENGRITIGFTMVDEMGNSYSSTSTEAIDEQYESQIDAICRAFDTFLRQCGYYRKGDRVLSDSITDEEDELLHEYLLTLRKQKAGEPDIESE